MVENDQIIFLIQMEVGFYMKYVVFLIVLPVVMVSSCITVPGREKSMRSIAIRRATIKFTNFTSCKKVKLYKIRRIDGTAGERFFEFRIGGCNAAMDFFVRCLKWNHTCPEGKMLSFRGGKKNVNVEALFKKLPLSSK
jgi:hypothetical protein